MEKTKEVLFLLERSMFLFLEDPSSFLPAADSTRIFTSRSAPGMRVSAPGLRARRFGTRDINQQLIPSAVFLLFQPSSRSLPYHRISSGSEPTSAQAILEIFALISTFCITSSSLQTRVINFLYTMSVDMKDAVSSDDSRPDVTSAHLSSFLMG